LFSLDIRRHWRDLIAAFYCIKGAYKKDGERLSTKTCSDRTRDNGFKLRAQPHGRGVGLDLQKSLPSKPFYDSINL